MRKTVILLNMILMCFTLSVGAQESVEVYGAEFNPALKRMLHGCMMLAQGVRENDCMMVGMAVDSLNSNENIPPEPVIVGKLAAKAVDTEGLLPIEDCFEFSDMYGHEWLSSHCGTAMVELPPLMRSYPAKCKVLKMRVAPKSSVVYSIGMKGKCHLFAIGEPGSAIELRIKSESEGEVKPVKFYENLWLGKWTGPSIKEPHAVTVSNNSDIPATIYLYSN